MLAAPQLDFRYYRLAPELGRHFTALHCLDFAGPPDLLVEDILPTEWLALRLTTRGQQPWATLQGSPLALCAGFAASGPSRRAIRFRIGPSRIWGLGLKPLGWAAFGRGALDGLRERVFDVLAEPALTALWPLPDLARDTQEDRDAVASRITAFLLSLKPQPVPEERRILSIEAALEDPAINDLAAFAAATGMARRTLQRLCLRHFGFAPKRLLRRQRFLRSFARYMMSSSSWAQAIEESYHDHAHFLRDFREFTGMSPRAYFAMAHPVLDRVKEQFMAEQGALPREAVAAIVATRHPVPHHRPGARE